MGALEIANTLASLTSLALRATQAANRVSSMVAAAQAEGRDLTEAEINVIRAHRAQAMQRWDEG